MSARTGIAVFGISLKLSPNIRSGTGHSENCVVTVATDDDVCRVTSDQNVIARSTKHDIKSAATGDCTPPRAANYQVTGRAADNPVVTSIAAKVPVRRSAGNQVVTRATTDVQRSTSVMSQRIVTTPTGNRDGFRNASMNSD